MEFKEIVAVTGLPGLYSIAGHRPDGVIVKSLENNKTQFASSRKHDFMLLENISIYTNVDSEPLYDVLKKMLENEQDNPVVDAKSDSATLKAYMKSLLPDYDEDKVYVSDIKKLIKWYFMLKEKDLIKLGEEEAEENTTDNEEEEASSEETTDGGQE